MAFERITVGAIGQTTATALVELGVRVDVTPSEPSLSRLEAELVDALARRDKVE